MPKDQVRLFTYVDRLKVVDDVTSDQLEERDALYDRVARTGTLPQKEQSEGTYIACQKKHWLARDAEMLTIALVGATKTAKSHFLAGLCYRLGALMIPSVDATVLGTAAGLQFFDAQRHVFERKRLLGGTQWSDREDIVPYVMNLRLDEFPDHPAWASTLAIYDFSGELAENQEELIQVAPFTTSVNAFLFFFSPTDLPGLSSAISQDGLTRVSSAMNMLGVFAHTWRLRNGLATAGRVADKVPIPTCIVINKADLLCNLDLGDVRYAKDIQQFVRSRVQPPRDLLDHERRILEETEFVVGLLRDAGCEGLVNKAFREFERPTFHLASPLGTNPPGDAETGEGSDAVWTETDYTLSGVCDPFVRAVYAGLGHETFRPDPGFLEGLVG